MEKVKYVKGLEIIFDEKLLFYKHISNMANECLKGLDLINDSQNAGMSNINFHSIMHTCKVS